MVHQIEPYNHKSKVDSFRSVGDAVHLNDLSSVVRFQIQEGATGLLLQPLDGDVYISFTTVDDDTPDATSFILKQEMLQPAQINIESGIWVAVLAAKVGAKLTYQVIR